MNTYRFIHISLRESVLQQVKGEFNYHHPTDSAGKTVYHHGYAFSSSPLIRSKNPFSRYD